MKEEKLIIYFLFNILTNEPDVKHAFKVHLRPHIHIKQAFRHPY